MPINLDRLRTGGALRGPIAQRAMPGDAAPRELTPGELIGPFKVVRELSRGGMAVVYLAERADGEFSQRVALKWMSLAGDRDMAEAMFRRERDIVASLEHPGIARLIDGGRSSDGMLWFAMELVEGENIVRWCASRGADLRMRVRLVAELCDALAYAHARLLIHRDIKPGNVLVGTDGRVKLLDFGIARLADQRDLLGNFALTPGFASPEQWRGDEVTIASDVYQTGLLMAVLLGALRDAPSAQHVTRVATVLEQTAQASEPVPLPATTLAPLPRDLACILARATALAPQERYAGIAAMAEDLRLWLAKRPVRARNGGVPYRVACLARRHPFGMALAVAALIALATLGWRVASERNVARQEARRALEAGERAQSSLEFLAGLLAWATPQRHRGRDVTVSEALQRGVEQLRADTTSPPLVRARLLFQMGRTYSQRRERETAAQLYQDAYDIVVKEPDADPFLRATIAFSLASQLSDGKDRARSHALIDEAMRLATPQSEDPTVYFMAWRLKAIRLNQDNRLADAVRENEAAFAAAEKRFGREHAVTARLMLDLSGRLLQSDREEEAFAYKRESYLIQRRLLGADHVDTSLASVGLTDMLVNRGELAQARRLLDEDGEVRRRLWGEDHPEFVRHLGALAQYQMRLGDFAAAIATNQRAIAILEENEALGRTLLSGRHLELATCLQRVGRYEEALAAAQRGLEPRFFDAKLGWDGGELVLAGARAARALGQEALAREYLARADGLWQALAENHVSRIALAIERGRLAMLAGERDAARSLAVTARRQMAARRFPDPLVMAELIDLETAVSQAGPRPSPP